MVLLPRKLRLNSVWKRTFILLLLWVLAMAAWCGVLDFREDEPDKEISLAHLRRSRSLMHYLDNINIVIEPSSAPCVNVEQVPVIAMVASHPANLQQRDAIRTTWGRHQPTFYLLGLDARDADRQLIETYMEAKEHDDLIVYDFDDHYQNLTVKTALMIQWTLNRCPQAQFMLKIDDDVFLNPWKLRDVLKKNEDAKLLGYLTKNVDLYRDKRSKWYLPRWLMANDHISEFVNGPSYLINGENLRPMLKAAYQVPMINIEDIYFTHLVASKLGYKPVFVKGMRPTKPWLMIPVSCIYWRSVTMHSMSPNDLTWVWRKVQYLAQGIDANTTNTICEGFFTKLLWKVMIW